MDSLDPYAVLAAPDAVVCPYRGFCCAADCIQAGECRYDWMQRANTEEAFRGRLRVVRGSGRLAAQP